MLKSIYVDGLRSLCDFKLELQPGLNVLVGPNGSGKSNILTAFELISGIHQLDVLSERLDSQVEFDIGDLFDIRRQKSKIDFAICGELDYPLKGFSDVQGNTGELVDLHYKYECEIIHQPEQVEKLVFGRQLLEINLSNKVDGALGKFIRLEFDNNELNIEKTDDEFFSKKIPIKDQESYFKYRSKVLTKSSLLIEFAEEIVPMGSIYFDSRTELCLNIDPTFIRYNIEKPKKHSISPRGMGLFSSLLEIFNNRKDLKNSAKVSDQLNYEEIYKKIIGYLNLINPELMDLEVSYNSEKKEIESYAIFKKNGERDRIPLKLMSDGTLKWLSVLIAVLTTKKILLMEEPENYLHPAMQTEFINLTRRMIGYGQNVAVISTHSESILDALDISEVIVTSFQKGHTIARRVENAEQIEEGLRETGFGLGWYYTTGSLDIEPETL